MKLLSAFPTVERPKGDNVTCTKLTTALSIVTLAFILAGCGGSPDTDGLSPTTQATREAAAAFTPDKSTCAPRGPSYTYKAGLRNNLPFAIRLDAGEYDCNDWSGVNTPGVAFTGKILQPGEALSFTLEPVKYTTRWWTLSISPAGGGTSFGTARLKLPQTVIYEQDSIQISASQEVFVSIPGSVAYKCSLLPMSPTNAPTTPQREYPDYFIDATPLGVISYDGRITLAGHCV